MLATDNDERHRAIAAALAGYAEVALQRIQVQDLVHLFPPDAELLLLDVGAEAQLAQKSVTAARRITDQQCVPLVLLTGSNSPEWISWCLEEGVEDVLTWGSPARLLRARIGAALERRRLRESGRTQARHLLREKQRTDSLVGALAQLGLMFSEERGFGRLLERILLEAKNFCHADAGTLYLLSDDDRLHFKIVRTDSLGIALGGTSGCEVPFAPLSLYEADGTPNHRFVVTSVALSGRSINIPDAYTVRSFDFSGTREFDCRTGYRSQSFLTVPLKNEKGRIIGVLQLINACDPDSGAVIPFAPQLERIVESLSCLASAALQSYIREHGLRQQIEALQIEIDEARKTRQVAEITGTDYFADLQRRAIQMRERT